MCFISDWTCPTVIEIIGLLTLAHFFIYLPLTKLAWLLNSCSSTAKKILTPNLHDYAVITGASDGIGLEYAKQLAEKGYNLLLLSRTEEKLKLVAGEIQKLYPQCRDVQICAVDFSKVDIYEKIREKLESLNGSVKILVNNVGIMTSTPEYFAKHQDGFHLKLINTNIVSMTAMSEMVLRMMANQKLDPKSKNPAKGVLINISSSASHAPFPLLSTYSASKIYMNYLSKILATEYEADKIIVQTVTPGMVDTKMAAGMKANTGGMFIVPADSFVRHALQTVGTEQETNGHPKHKFISGLMNAVSVIIGPKRSLKWMFNMNKSIKEKSEKKVQPITMDNPLSDANLNNA